MTAALVKRIELTDVPNFGIPYLELPHNSTALECAKRFAKTRLPSILLVAGDCGDGKTRLINLTISYVMKEQGERSIYYIAELRPDHLNADFTEIEGSMLVIGGITSWALKKLGVGGLRIWIDKQLKKQISVIIETCLDLSGQLKVPKNHIYHAKLEAPSFEDKAAFARHCFPIKVGRDLDNEGWKACEVLGSSRSLRAVELEIVKMKVLEDLPLYQAANALADFFHDYLINNPRAQKARDYLKSHGLSESTIKEFKIGFTPDDWWEHPSLIKERGISLTDAFRAGFLRATKNSEGVDGFSAMAKNRITIPFHGKHGLNAISYRSIEKDQPPKYIGPIASPIFEKTFFAHPDAWRAIHEAGHAIIVEGHFDVISLWAAGIKNVLGLCGTSMTEAQARHLSKLDVVLMFDGDEAGWNGAYRAATLLLKVGAQPKIARLFKSKGPKNILARVGPEGLLEKVRRAIPFKPSQDLEDVCFSEPS